MDENHVVGERLGEIGPVGPGRYGGSVRRLRDPTRPVPAQHGHAVETEGRTQMARKSRKGVGLAHGGREPGQDLGLLSARAASAARRAAVDTKALTITATTRNTRSAKTFSARLIVHV
jgi:hypothetical protein